MQSVEITSLLNTHNERQNSVKGLKPNAECSIGAKTIGSYAEPVCPWCHSVLVEFPTSHLPPATGDAGRSPTAEPAKVMLSLSLHCQAAHNRCSLPDNCHCCCRCCDGGDFVQQHDSAVWLTQRSIASSAAVRSRRAAACRRIAADRTSPGVVRKPDRPERLRRTSRDPIIPLCLLCSLPPDPLHTPNPELPSVSDVETEGARCGNRIT
jgi:hypothetical protein